MHLAFLQARSLGQAWMAEKQAHEFRPGVSADAGDGGSSDVNLWTVNNSPFTNGTAAAPVKSDASGYTVLSYSQNLYK